MGEYGRIVSTVKPGSVNFPKMLNHLKHRTNQVRYLTLYRAPIHRKDVRTQKSDNNTDLAGPPVSFGYETDSFAAQSAGDNQAYHISSPEIVVPRIQALQSPIISRSGQLGRGGHRITGACKFYLPAFRNIKNQVGTDIDAFESIETYDTFYDMEELIMPFGFSGGVERHYTVDEMQPNPNPHDTLSRNVWSGNRAGTSMDRFQCLVSGSDTHTPNDGTAGTIRLSAIQFHAMQSGVAQNLIWYPTGALGGSVPWGNPSGNRTGGTTLPLEHKDALMIDLPMRDVKTGDTTTVYNTDGTAITFNALLSTSSWGTDLDGSSTLVGQDPSTYPAGAFDLDLQYSNTDVDNRFSYASVILDSNLEMTDDNTVSLMAHGWIYKSAEWRVESVKDYRDEYMEISAVRVRGERSSRRRAYG